MKVMMYDRCAFSGSERLLKNFRAISSAASSSLGLDIQTYDRHKRFDAQNGAEDVLLQEPFPYDAVIIRNGIENCCLFCKGFLQNPLRNPNQALLDLGLGSR